MAINWDPAYIMNLVLCVIIVVLGYIGYAKHKNKVPLYIAIAFGLFGLSHLATILSFSVTTVLIIIRILAYLLVAYALYLFIKK